MIENLTHQKSEVENKIHEVEKQLEQQNGEHSELSKELERLKSQLSTLEFKLTDKREKLSAADEALAEFRAMTRAQKSEAETLRVVQEQTSRTLQTYAQASILAGSFQELLTMSSRICANVPEAKKWQKTPSLKICAICVSKMYLAQPLRCSLRASMGQQASRNREVAVAQTRICLGGIRTRIFSALPDAA